MVRMYDIRALLHLSLFILLVSCGPAHKLRKAQRLIDAAINDGAKVKKDTVYKMVSWKTPPRELTEKLIVDKDWNNLLVKGKDSLSVKIRRVPGPPGKRDTLYLEAKCPPIDVQQEVPVAINQKISAGYTLWDMIILAIFCIAVGYFIAPIVVNTIKKKKDDTNRTDQGT